jgi:hypothetical protein
MTKQEARRNLKDVRNRLKGLRADVRRNESAERRYLKAAKKMKPGGGRNKGNSFERVVAHKIVTAFSKAGFDFDDRDCYRTPSSGGHRYAKHEDPGDLVIAPKLLKVFPYSVECKDQKSLELYRFFIPFSRHKSSWPEHQFLAQALAAAKLKKRLAPMLVFKYASKIWCAFPCPIMTYPPSMTFLYPDQYSERAHWQLTLLSRFLKRHAELMKKIGHSKFVQAPADERASDIHYRAHCEPIEDVVDKKKAKKVKSSYKDGDYGKLADFIMQRK